MRLRNFSINAKLNVMLALAAGVALSISVLAFVANDVRILRTAKISNLTALADLVGTASVEALERNDVFTASELLSALRLQSTVTYAGLYGPDGQLLAEYRSQDALDYEPPPPRASGYDFQTRRHLDVFDEIKSGDRVVGTIHLHANTNDLYVQFQRYFPIVTLILIVSLSASLFLSMRLRKLVSQPILRLAETAERISSSGDHSIRVHRQDRDEIGTLYDQFNAMLDQIERGEHELQQAHSLMEQRVRDRTAELTQANSDLTREMADRESAERELAILHDQLVDAARRAGMAEIATGVLHNVGNVLNSVNVSCTLVADRLQKAKVADLERIVELLQVHSDDLGRFLGEHEQGKQVLRFLDLLARHLNGEQSFLLSETASLTKNIEHIKSIVAMQQSYAGISGVIESVSIAELLDRAIALNETAFLRHGFEVSRDYEDLPEICTDHQKLLQIVVNLLQNARDALLDSDQVQPCLRVRLYRSDENLVRVEVSDNGMGILPENLSRIFSHGFTTKHNGHGFGLHSCANSAAEMGGQPQGAQRRHQAGSHVHPRAPLLARGGCRKNVPLNRRLLIVDDNEAIHDDFRKVFGSLDGDAGALEDAAASLFGTPRPRRAAWNEFEIISAHQGEEPVTRARLAKESGVPFALAFVDVRMPPGLDGIETVRRLWEVDPALQVVVCTAHSDYSLDQMLDRLGRCDRLVILKKPFDNIEVSQLAIGLTEKWRLARQARLRTEDLEQLVDQRTQEILATRDVAVFALAQLAESRDPETGQHLERIRKYCRILARELQRSNPYRRQIDDQFIDDLYRSSPLHDIGKVGIPDAILLKPGRLSEQEFNILKKHTVIGANALERAATHTGSGGFLRMAAEIARFHHERFDGTGYPSGLRGTEIPLCARIVALADVYDALTSARVYKSAYDSDLARMMIEEESGRHFDPVIVAAFRVCYGEFVELQATLETDEIDERQLAGPLAAFSA